LLTLTDGVLLMDRLQTLALLVLIALAASGCAATGGSAAAPAPTHMTPTYFPA
jgi:hypothetical protein